MKRAMDSFKQKNKKKTKKGKSSPYFLAMKVKDIRSLDVEASWARLRKY